MPEQDAAQPVEPVTETPPEAVAPAFAVLAERFGADLVTAHEGADGPDFTVAPGRLADFVAALREGCLAESHLFVDACGVERETCLEVVYRFSLVSRREIVTVRAQMPKATPAVTSLAETYPGARWPEREYAEMFGITVTGHPDMRHLLLPEGWEGYPLRKDYVYPVDHPYLAPDPLREDPVKVLGHAPEEGEEPQIGSSES
jgi:NADH:ubiquinone oxidoreductase subunit C